MRLLIAEDERDLNAIITKRLTKEGYSVDSCFDGEEALDFIDMVDYDCIILDIMMPKKDGISVLTELRARGKDTPVLFLTARDSIEDKIKGLDTGANDYMVKPFAFEELVARIRAITRSKFGMSRDVVTCSDLEMDFSAHSVKRGGRSIDLSSKEYALLEYLLRNKGRVLTREQIEDHIWNFDYEGGTNVVDVYIRYLRKKIDEDFEQKLIHTVRGSGYVLRDE